MTPQRQVSQWLCMAPRKQTNSLPQWVRPCAICPRRESHLISSHLCSSSPSSGPSHTSFTSVLLLPRGHPCLGALAQRFPCWEDHVRPSGAGSFLLFLAQLWLGSQKPFSTYYLKEPPHLPPLPSSVLILQWHLSPSATIRNLFVFFQRSVMRSGGVSLRCCRAVHTGNGVCVGQALSKYLTDT